MRIFEQDPELYDAKINFIDKNNVFVGFDYTHKCCEEFGYIISDHIPNNKEELYQYLSSRNDNINYDEYIFDQSFNYSVPDFDNQDIDDDDYNAQHMSIIVFKLISELTKKELYLTLFNDHNGAYSHGFECKHNEHLLYTGSL